jgi:hypothetical protein
MDDSAIEGERAASNSMLRVKLILNSKFMTFFNKAPEKIVGVCENQWKNEEARQVRFPNFFFM